MLRLLTVLEIAKNKSRHRWISQSSLVVGASARQTLSFLHVVLDAFVTISGLSHPNLRKEVSGKKNDKQCKNHP